MPTSAHGQPGVGRSVSGPVGRRPNPSTPEQLLGRLSSRLDMLIRDVGLRAHSHREVERRIEEAEAIAAGIRGVFRAPSAPANPPLWQAGGRAAW